MTVYRCYRRSRRRNREFATVDLFQYTLQFFGASLAGALSPLDRVGGWGISLSRYWRLESLISADPALSVDIGPRSVPKVSHIQRRSNCVRRFFETLSTIGSWSDPPRVLCVRTGRCGVAWCSRFRVDIACVAVVWILLVSRSCGYRLCRGRVVAESNSYCPA